MPTIQEYRQIIHIRFFNENRLNEVVRNFETHGWTRDFFEAGDEEFEFIKEAGDRYWTALFIYHASHRNWGISFKHGIHPSRTFTDEEFEIYQEREQGIYRIHARKRNNESGRIALFTRRHSEMMAFDADYLSGNYEDNGEEVQYSIPWSWGSWTNLEE